MLCIFDTLSAKFVVCAELARVHRPQQRPFDLRAETEGERDAAAQER